MFLRVQPLTGIMPTEVLWPLVSEDLKKYICIYVKLISYLRDIPVALDCALWIVSLVASTRQDYYKSFVRLCKSWEFISLRHYVYAVIFFLLV